MLDEKRSKPMTPIPIYELGKASEAVEIPLDPIRAVNGQLTVKAALRIVITTPPECECTINKPSLSIAPGLEFDDLGYHS